MRTSSRSNPLPLAVACALAMVFTSGVAVAQNMSPNTDRDTWAENSRTQIWRNAYGECWRNMYGPPPGSNECNPAPVAQYVPPPPAPAPYVAPPPPRAPYVAPVQPAPAPYVAPERPRKKDRN